MYSEKEYIFFWMKDKLTIFCSCRHLCWECYLAYWTKNSYVNKLF